MRYAPDFAGVFSKHPGFSLQGIESHEALFLILITLCCVTTTTGQASSSDVAIITTYSQNEKYYLKSIPFDGEFPTLNGKTLVYERGNPEPLYVFDRGFDSVEEGSNNLILSNDGQVIFYLIPWEANENKEGLKSITIYKAGRIVKSFTETDVNGCDKRKERCALLYSNYEQVVDKQKSNWGTVNYKKALKDGVDDKEKFLSDFPIFSFDDFVYVTDSKRIVHIFDLKDWASVRSEPFDKYFEQIRTKGRFNRTTLTHYQSHVFLTFPKLNDGRDAYKSLAAHLRMKSADLIEPKDQQYKLYTFKVSVDISRDGNLTVESIDVDDGLPKQKILDFFSANKFDISAVQSVFEKWHLRDEFFSFRNANDQIARKEKQQEIAEARINREKRMTLEMIDGVYIPKDLGDCFVELDKRLSEIDRKEMAALPKRDNMIVYHLSLGMWMRNNWGLWGGSRLYKYFQHKGLSDPEDMSSIVLFYYYDWLTDKKESWKQWETNPRRPFAESTDQRFTNTINARPRP